MDLALGRLVLAHVGYPGAPITSGNSVTLEFCADSDGVPGAVLRSVTVEDGMPLLPGVAALVRFAFGSTQALSTGETYWIVLRASTSTYAVWLIACQDQPMPGMGKRQRGNNPWQALPFTPQQYRGGVHEYCPNAFRVTSP